MKQFKDPKEWFKQNVSRETFLGLETYERLLIKWQNSINLVSKTTLGDIWLRHFMDSYQLGDVIRQNVSRETFCLADLGSGAGFPGMILAIAGFPKIHLIESDQRKCAFLREVSLQLQNVSRETFSKPTIHNNRIEGLDLKADIITCRAFAEINKILEISQNIRKSDTIYYLLKSLDIDLELTNATKYWYFKHQIMPSATDARGCILILSDVKPK